MLTPSSLWLLTAAVQVLAVLRAQSSKTTPRFFRTYLWFEAAASPVAFIVREYAGDLSFFYAFYAIAFITNLLTFLIAWEIYCFVFGPRAALPEMVPEKAGALAAMGFSGAIALGVFIPALLGGDLTRAMVQVEQVLTAASWAVFVILVIYSLSLRIAWPRRVAGLAIGFVLYLSIDVLAVFARASGGYEVAAVAGTVGQMAYLLALVVWTCVFWKREQAAVPVTPEQVETIRHYHLQSMEALVRCGIKLEK